MNKSFSYSVLLPLRINIFIVLFFLLTSTSFAADRYWIATASANWNNTSNWSTSSGGSGGASVPGLTDVAIFNGASASNGACTIDASVDVLGLTITAGYSGTINQGANSILVRGTGATLSGGIFNGGIADITINGSLAISGTSFTSTSGTLTVGAGNDFTFSSGTFAHNNGTVQINIGANKAITGNLTFNNLTFHNTFGPYACYITSGTTLTVNGTLTLSGTNSTELNTGTVNVKGDIVVTNTSGSGGGDATFLISGTGTQSITNSIGLGSGKLPQVIINKASGQLNLVGTIVAGNNWTYTAGTVNAGTAKMIFAGNFTITGSQTFYDIEFNATFANYILSIASGTQLTATHNLYFSGSQGVKINTGIINVLGDVAITNASQYGGGDATILLNGITDQTITGSGTSNVGRLPKVTINKPSGTLHLVSVISVGNNWTYTAGTLDMGTSKIVFSDDFTITGTHTLNDVEFSSPSYLAGTFVKVATGTIFTVSGHTYVTGADKAMEFISGTIECKGDITITNTSEWTGGNALIKINGTSNQTLTGSGVSMKGCLPKVEINKSAGSLTLVSVISASNDWTYTAGTLIPGTSKVVFRTYTTITGTHTLNDIEFNTLKWGYTLTVANGTVLTAAGSLYISNVVTYLSNSSVIDPGANPSITLNGGTIEVSKNLEVSNIGTAGGGSTIIKFIGIGAQSFSSTVAAGEGRLPNIIINRTSGSLTMSGVISVTGDWTYTDGVVDPGTSTVYFLNAKNLDATGNSGTMSFYNLTLGDNNLRTLQGNITINNILSLGNGKIKLSDNISGYTCFVNNSSPLAIARNTGYIIGELTNNSSKLSWNIGPTNGSYIYPFATASGANYIPFVFELTAGDAGIVTVSTYPTTTSNTPYPSAPDVVTNMSWNNNADFSSSAIDRFWQIDKSGVSATATVTYTYAPAEVTGNVVGGQSILYAQRYNAATNVWQNPRSSQTANAAQNSVTETGVTQFSPRMLAIHAVVLPVKLVQFSATAVGKSVEIKWATATETNSAYFVVERSIDSRTYEEVGTVKAAGTSDNYLNYSTIDNEPFPGKAFYRLKQVDIDGRTSYSPVAIVDVRNSKEITLLSNSGTLTIKLSGFNAEELIRVFDGNGRLVHQEICNGTSQTSISTKAWSKGVYTIVVASERKRFLVQ